jgi:hypothetical protein
VDICVPLHASTALCPVKNPTRQANGAPLKLSGHSGEEKNILPLQGPLVMTYEISVPVDQVLLTFLLCLILERSAFT